MRWMQKLMLLFSVAALPLPLITATQHSGFVGPEHRFSIVCTLSEDGKLISKLNAPAEDGTWGTFETTKTLTSDAMTEIKIWIAEAASGEFSQRPNPCDIGGESITARIADKSLDLYVSEDCG